MASDDAHASAVLEQLRLAEEEDQLDEEQREEIRERREAHEAEQGGGSA